MGSVAVAQGLSCSKASGPGIEPMSLALAGGFLSTATQGSPYSFYGWVIFHYIYMCVCVCVCVCVCTPHLLKLIIC